MEDNKNLTEEMEKETKKEEKKAKKTTKKADKNAEIIAEKDKEIESLQDQLLRLAAEYDNFKKRTQKEKEALYKDVAADTIAELLPVIDNLERALLSFDDKENPHYKGVEMVCKQTNDIFKKLGVEEIKALGEEFNPELHNAVMHIDDETVADNTIVEEFQKGYTYKEKVIRYSMVKVAN